MPRRPDIFNREKLEEALRAQGYSQSWVDTIVSNYRLIAPVLLKEIGVDGIVGIMLREQSAYGRHTPEDVWRNIAKPLVVWATDALASEGTDPTTE
jgi:hypothetical protein